MDIKKELAKFIDNPSLIEDNCKKAECFDISVEYNGYWPIYPEFNLDIQLDYDDDNNAWINIIWHYKCKEFYDFIENIKADNFSFFDNIGAPEGCPYNDDYPHKMFAFPFENGFTRFLIISCEDYDHDEYVLADVLVNKNILIEQLEKTAETIEKKVQELKQ